MRRVTATAAKVFIFEAVIGAILFGCAGRLDLPWFWALIAVHATALLLGMVRMDPELERERRRPASGPSGKEYLHRLGGTFLIIAHLAIAGLDAGRYHWSPPPPLAARIVALVVYALALGFSMWAIAENRFFSSVVRLQSDRGHHVIDTGPYRYVRHPGYASAVIMVLCSGLALGSWLSLLPSALAIVALVVRTRFEERVLRDGLPGYDEYTHRVPYRLLPGVW